MKILSRVPLGVMVNLFTRKFQQHAPYNSIQIEWKKLSPFFLIAILIFTTIKLEAQTTVVPQITPVSPEAYSLGKYGQVPVSLYSGVPNISLPIGSLQNIDVSVDVSLSYHGSGIKVDENASKCGIGWSVNAGGMITRSVRGKPDDLANIIPRNRMELSCPKISLQV